MLQQLLLSHCESHWQCHSFGIINCNYLIHFTNSRAAAKKKKVLILSHDAGNVQNTTAETPIPEKDSSESARSTSIRPFNFDPSTGVPPTFSNPGGEGGVKRGTQVELAPPLLGGGGVLVRITRLR